MLIKYFDPETGNENIDYIDSVSAKFDKDNNIGEITFIISISGYKLVMSKLTKEAVEIVMNKLFTDEKVDVSIVDCCLFKLNLEDPDRTATIAINLDGYLGDFHYPDDDDCYE